MRILFLAILFTLSSCLNNNPDNAYQYNEDVRIARQIRKKVALKIQKETGLRPCGTGGSMRHGVKMLALSFHCDHDLSIDEGRHLLIQSVDEFVNEINNDERIHSYLIDKPFGPKNVEIRIFRFDPDRDKEAQGKPIVFSSISGLLEYEIRDPESGKLKTILEETYEEALSKMNLQERTKLRSLN